MEKKRYQEVPIQQKKMLRYLMTGEAKSKKQAAIMAGYSPNSASSITKSKTWQQLCAAHGLTQNLILDCLVQDIEAKPGKRVGELGLGADILGMRKMAQINVGVQFNVGDIREEYA